jgi:hypothetical protein
LIIAGDRELESVSSRVREEVGRAVLVAMYNPLRRRKLKASTGSMLEPEIGNFMACNLVMSVRNEKS